jgi:hypothetical protein
VDVRGWALRACLADSGPNPKEGELAFYWTDIETGACLTQLSFYLRRGDHGPEIYVGGLQGPMNEQSREWIRLATKASEGLRPKDVVMEALLAFAAHVGARRVAVSRANHVSRQRNTPREIQADYEGFWRNTTARRLRMATSMCRSASHNAISRRFLRRSGRPGAASRHLPNRCARWWRTGCADAVPAGNDPQLPVAAAVA